MQHKLEIRVVGNTVEFEVPNHPVITVSPDCYGVSPHFQLICYNSASEDMTLVRYNKAGEVCEVCPGSGALITTDGNSPWQEARDQVYRWVLCTNSMSSGETPVSCETDEYGNTTWELFDTERQAQEVIVEDMEIHLNQFKAGERDFDALPVDLYPARAQVNNAQSISFRGKTWNLAFR